MGCSSHLKTVCASAERTRLAATQQLQGVLRRAHLRLKETLCGAAAARLQGSLRAVGARVCLRERKAAAVVLAGRVRGALQQVRVG